jgi:Trypsin
VTGIQFAPRARLRLAVLAAILVTFCGGSVQPADAIIGGQAATPGYFGYVAFVAAVGDGTAYYCTGALVTPSVVLTAAHCAILLSTPSAFTVGTGRLNLYDSSTGQVVGVSAVAIAPTWSPTTSHGDVGLLQLAQPSAAATLPIASASDSSWAYQPDNTIVVAGWGRTSLTGPAASQLNWIDLGVQSDDYCAEQAANGKYGYDAASMFCASQPGSLAGACYGDSGAPAITQSASGAYEIVGVASFLVTSDCAPPDVFARVTYSSAWLSSEIAILQATAAGPLVPTFTPPAPTLLPPAATTPPARTRPSLTTRSSTGTPGKLAKLTFWPGSRSGRVRVHLRIFNRGALVYSKTTRDFQPAPRAWSLAWRVPPRLRHSVRFCMSATLLASTASSAPSCSTLRIGTPRVR